MLTSIFNRSVCPLKSLKATVSFDEYKSCIRCSLYIKTNKNKMHVKNTVTTIFFLEVLLIINSNNRKTPILKATPSALICTAKIRGVNTLNNV